MSLVEGLILLQLYRHNPIVRRLLCYLDSFQKLLKRHPQLIFQFESGKKSKVTNPHLAHEIARLIVAHTIPFCSVGSLGNVVIPTLCCWL